MVRGWRHHEGHGYRNKPNGYQVDDAVRVNEAPKLRVKDRHQLKPEQRLNAGKHHTALFKQMGGDLGESLFLGQVREVMSCS
jgi:hypothetical protein